MQWLGLGAFITEVLGSVIPAGGNKISQVMEWTEKKSLIKQNKTFYLLLMLIINST